MPRPLLVPVALLLALLMGCAGADRAPRATGSAVAPPASEAVIAEVPDGFRGGTVTLSDLPPEALQTLLLITDGGPYPYDQDDGVFSNREGLLPSEPRGYYREYTVRTPGSSDRGARRLVTGTSGERYYTDDHYDSFRFVVDR